jgi:hypothetical protein
VYALHSQRTAAIIGLEGIFGVGLDLQFVIIWCTIHVAQQGDVVKANNGLFAHVKCLALCWLGKNRGVGFLLNSQIISK